MGGCLRKCVKCCKTFKPAETEGLDMCYVPRLIIIICYYLLFCMCVLCDVCVLCWFSLRCVLCMCVCVYGACVCMCVCVCVCASYHWKPFI